MMQPIEPTQPVAAWIGGKRNLAKRITAILDGLDHALYVEPFAGMGGIFLRRSARPDKEVINDISTDVTTLFRILQRHYPQFIDVLRFQVSSRAEFERLKNVPPETLTDLERAARFLYLQRLSFGGKVAGQNFGVSKGHGARFNLTKLEPMLQALHERLSGVVIERLPYAELIGRYDGKGTLFYLDPPYFGNEDDYGKDLFAPSDFARLAALLAGIEGRFIMSINDVPEIRSTFGKFRFSEVSTTYGLSRPGERATARAELLISNFPIQS